MESSRLTESRYRASSFSLGTVPVGPCLRGGTPAGADVSVMTSRSRSARLLTDPGGIRLRRRSPGARDWDVSLAGIRAGTAQHPFHQGHDSGYVSRSRPDRGVAHIDCDRYASVKVWGGSTIRTQVGMPQGSRRVLRATHDADNAPLMVGRRDYSAPRPQILVPNHTS